VEKFEFVFVVIVVGVLL